MAAGVYLHIPFCKSRCSYCDFATDVWRSGEAVEQYVEAICREIAGFTGHSVVADTVYFGGGTPSLLKATQVEKILETVRKTFELTADTEITLEMNPATVTLDKLRAYLELGINRASFGVQTFNDKDLKLLARGHNSTDAHATFELLRNAGFRNISFDLIAGLPGQTLADWWANLEDAVSMDPEPLSLYLLEVHEGTPLAAQLRTSRRTTPDDELAAEMYERMIDRLSASGYEQYEISNFSKHGFGSRHNIKYWRLEPVFGFGVSAHSFDGKERYANDRDTSRYVAKIDSSQTAEVYRETIDPASEAAFLGLRMTEGIDLKEYKNRYGNKIDDIIPDLQEKRLVRIAEGYLQLTRKGMLFSNEVFKEFV